MCLLHALKTGVIMVGLTLKGQFQINAYGPTWCQLKEQLKGKKTYSFG